MSIPVALLLLAGAFTLTVASSVVLARELDRIGERLGFSEALLGIVTALGADAPEIASAVAAILAGHEDTGVGVVVGSNVFNIAGLLGVSALLAGPVRIHKHGLALTGGVAVAVALIGALLAVGVLPGVASLLLVLLVLAPYVVVSALHSRSRARLPAFLREAVAEEQQDARRDEFARPASGLDALAVVPALAAVVGGAYGMVAAAQSLADRWDVSDVVLGALVLAALTSIPNLIAAVRLALHGRGAACVSESLNSNNANVLVGLCVPALILGIGSASGIEIFAAWWMVGMTALAVGLGFGGGLTRREGTVIVALYVVFAVVLASS
ncbi:MAG: sodium:calcium antiporter [Gaiellaceae bacterium]